MTKTMRDMLERAGWTAAEAFLAVIVVTDVNSLKAAAAAGVAAGISVVKTYAKERAAVR